MWRNYFAAALHNLFRNRAYAAINICGLALGLAAVLLIALYVRGEYSFDAQIADAGRIYRFSSETTQPGLAPVHLPTTTANIAAAMELDFSEVEFATRLKAALGALKQGDVEVVPDNFLWGDPDFFRMFPVKVLAGDPDAALARPDGLVLSRRMARRLFGREDVVGREVTFNRQQQLRVGAVIEDMPWNSHLVLDVVAAGIASFSPLTQLDRAANNPGDVQQGNVYTYVKLRPGASIQAINAAMPAFMDRHYPNKAALRATGAQDHYTLVPLRELHFQPPSVALDLKPSGSLAAVHAMMLIAVVILLVAAGNFVSMMTARAARRAIEVGVRKAVGATRRQIAGQFLGECLFYSGLAVAIALLAAWLAMPAFNGFLQRDMGFDFARDPLLTGMVLAAWLAVGVAAGLYPALVLAGFRPVTALHGAATLPGGSGRLRQGMVALQFGTLVALLIATLTVYRQTRFALEDRLHVPGRQVFWSQFSCGVAPTLRDAVAALPGVLAASCASEWEQTGITLSFTSTTGGPVRVRGQPVDTAYLPLLGLKPLAGRLLDVAHGEDNVLAAKGAAPDAADGTPPPNPSIVVNEAAARALGYAEPRNAAGATSKWQRPALTAQGGVRRLDARESRIVGVIPDFSLGSVRDRIEPTAYYLDPVNSFSLYVMLDGARIAETMRRIEVVWKNTMGPVPFKGRFLDQALNDLYADIRRQTRLFALFSLVAVVVSALGLLGLAVFTAERRTREIGVRKALGASRVDILRFLGWQFARPVLLANLIAWPVAWFFMHRWLEGFAYRVGLGPLAFLLASALALGIALVTVIGHSLMVSRARPVEALRYE
jgi:putative ABC transport system permease protein